jgi:hypothetical protein
MLSELNVEYTIDRRKLPHAVGGKVERRACFDICERSTEAISAACY